MGMLPPSALAIALAKVQAIGFLFAIGAVLRAEKSMVDFCSYSVLLFLLSADGPQKVH
jgi:hypothetical protein